MTSGIVTSDIVTPFTSVMENERLRSVSSYSVLSMLLREICSVQLYPSNCLVLVSRDYGRNTPSDRTVQDYVTWKKYGRLYCPFILHAKCG